MTAAEPAAKPAAKGAPRNGRQAIGDIVEALSNVKEYLYVQDRVEQLRYGDRDSAPGRSRLALQVDAAHLAAVELLRTMVAASMEISDSMRLM